MPLLVNLNRLYVHQLYPFAIGLIRCHPFLLPHLYSLHQYPVCRYLFGDTPLFLCFANGSIDSNPANWRHIGKTISKYLLIPDGSINSVIAQLKYTVSLNGLNFNADDPVGAVVNLPLNRTVRKLRS